MPQDPSAADPTAADGVAAEGEVVDDPEADAVAAAEELEVDLDLLLKEREEYLELSRRLQADFQNYKKRVIKQQTEHLERAAGSLVEKLLPVLDTFDLAIQHGPDADDRAGVEAVYRSLLGVLESEGLERLDPIDKPFDPNEHDAVAHEPGDVEQPVVAEVMRAGYRWKGRVLRPAMVKVKG